MNLFTFQVETLGLQVVRFVYAYLYMTVTLPVF
jgi:hypothetical protein